MKPLEVAAIPTAAQIAQEEALALEIAQDIAALVSAAGTFSGTGNDALAYLALQTAWSGTSGADFAIYLASQGTNEAAAAIDLANSAFVLAESGTATASGSTPGQITLTNDLAGPAQAPVVVSASGTFAFKGIITATLGAAANNYDASEAVILRLTPDASFNTVMTGVTGGAPGRFLIICNVDQTGLKLTLRPGNGASASANQFQFNGNNDFILQNNQGLILEYDSVLSKWISAFPGILIGNDIGGTQGSPIVLKASTSFQFSGTATPAQITSNQNDYNFGTGVDMVRVSSDAARDITGIAISNTTGKFFILHNIGSFPVTLVNQSALSTSVNRFDIVSDYAVQPSTAVCINYDLQNSRWRLVGFSPSDIYGLANEALAIAISGTNTAYTALQTAWSGTAGANAAYALATSGTNEASAAIGLANQVYATAATGTLAAAAAIALANQGLATAWTGTAEAGAAIDLANQVYALASTGTNEAAAAIGLANQALKTAFTGTSAAAAGISLANQALTTAFTGTSEAAAGIGLGNQALTTAFTGTSEAAAGIVLGNQALTSSFAGTTLAYTALTTAWSGTGTFRTVLKVATTYFVSTTGNDANDGLTVSTPFATIQHAVNVIAAFDLGNALTHIIQLADGTYNEQVTISNMIGSGLSLLTITGNASTPTNVVVDGGSGGTCFSVNTCYTQVRVQNFKVQNSGSGGQLLQCTNHSFLTYGNIIFGTTSTGGFHLSCLAGSKISCVANYTIAAGAAAHWSGLQFGVIACQAKTVTITGTQAFATAFALVTTMGDLEVNGNTFSGVATGVRFNASTNGIINSAGGGANYLPGNSAGVTATGGQYI